MWDGEQGKFPINFHSSIISVPNVLLFMQSSNFREKEREERKLENFVRGLFENEIRKHFFPSVYYLGSSHAFNA